MKIHLVVALTLAALIALMYPAHSAHAEPNWEEDDYETSRRDSRLDRFSQDEDEDDQDLGDDDGLAYEDGPSYRSPRYNDEEDYRPRRRKSQRSRARRDYDEESQDYSEPRQYEDDNFAGEREIVRPARRARPTRRLASLDSDYSSDGESYDRYGRRSRRGKNAIGGRIGLMGGMTSASASNSGEQTLRSSGGYGSNFAVGGVAEITYSYIGLELEGYFGLSSAKETVVGTGVFTTSTESRAIQQLGFSGILMGHYPFHLGKVEFRPKLGAGYGVVMTKLTSDGASASAEESNQVGGILGLVGFDLLPIPKLLISADFAMSVVASGDTQVVNGDTSNVFAGQAAGLMRIRFGAYYEVYDRFLFGGQFSLRNMTLDTSTAIDERQMQFLVMLLYRL